MDEIIERDRDKTGKDLIWSDMFYSKRLAAKIEEGNEKCDRGIR